MNELPDTCKQTKEDDNFLIYDFDGDEDEIGRILIFASKQNLLTFK